MFSDVLLSSGSGRSFGKSTHEFVVKNWKALLLGLGMLILALVIGGGVEHVTLGAMLAKVMEALSDVFFDRGIDVSE